MDERQLALAMYLGTNPDEISPDYGNTYYIGRQEYLVLTDEEATEAAEESIDSLLNDMLHDVDPYLRNYFDRERYIEDVIRYDGRGHVLSSWDGSEGEVKLEEGTAFNEALQAWKDSDEYTQEELDSFLSDCQNCLDGTWYYIYRNN